MKETLYTIPLTDAFAASDECPLCFIERKLEQDSIEFILGSAYMESDIREETDKHGFCKDHLKKMYDYGNALGNALILETHYKKLSKEMDKLFESASATAPTSFFKKITFPFRSKFSSPARSLPLENPVANWVHDKNNECYLCSMNHRTYERYLDTFFYLYRKDPSFHNTVKDSKGFCMHHFGDLMEASCHKLDSKEKSSFYPMIFHLMKENLNRVQEDLSWFIKKFDHLYQSADWKTSKDAVPRGIQKLAGGYPADLPFREKK